jgi:hypothetical protein
MTTRTRRPPLPPLLSDNYDPPPACLECFRLQVAWWLLGGDKPPANWSCPHGRPA